MKQTLRVALVASLSLIVIAAAVGYVQQSNTQHLKFSLGCSGFPICVYVISPTAPGFTLGTPAATVVNMNITLNIVSTSNTVFSNLYLNTTIFNAPAGITFRWNNLNATLPTTFTSANQWRNGPFALSANGSTRGLFQLFINSTAVANGPIGQYDIGFTVIQ
jgi:hypothetical protein